MQKYILRVDDIQFGHKLRKRVKIDVNKCQQCDQFKGQAIQLEISHNNNTKKNVLLQAEKKINIKQQISTYTKIFENIKKNPKAHKKIQEDPEKSALLEAPRFNLQLKPAKNTQIKNQKKQKVSQNWKKFLQQQKQTDRSKQKHTKHKKQSYQFVAIDCQFVKSGEQDCLARVSIVNEHGDQLYDSYVKPKKKITDFVTDVSGITYGHIKNAPSQDEVLPQIKKKILNKIAIGHTIDKDLEVCGLKNWTGFKKIIDIADTHPYSPAGKRISLKKLSYNHLGKLIQEGWHSSVEDANATMQLFLKHKQQILKQKKIVKS